MAWVFIREGERDAKPSFNCFSVFARLDNSTNWQADLKNRELVLECGINTQYLVARVAGDQRKEGTSLMIEVTIIRALFMVCRGSTLRLTL